MICPSRRFRGLAALAMTAAIGALCAPAMSLAQSFKSVQVPVEPLVLKSRGSFYVGGRTVERTVTLPVRARERERSVR